MHNDLICKLQEVQTKYAIEHDQNVQLKYNLENLHKKLERIRSDASEQEDHKEFSKIKREVARKETEIKDVRRENEELKDKLKRAATNAEKQTYNDLIGRIGVNKSKERSPRLSEINRMDISKESPGRRGRSPTKSGSRPMKTVQEICEIALGSKISKKKSEKSNQSKQNLKELVSDKHQQRQQEKSLGRESND